ncbi:MAG: AbrB/MazE/SpoVT family DNA-binding domain-containing protein, partial [Candidatus Aenigmarchaeota archaeon]|nr:AbrB/MazE/SpoVT family DNA-binding domain-containing protein [Candidatus Aenigmarchaeota archaeon]
MAEIATISTKGQVVIPSHIRQELGLKEGSQLVVSRMEDLI